MTAKLNCLSIIALIIAHFIFINNVSCLPEIKAVVEPTKTNTILNNGLENFLPDISEEKHSRFANYKDDFDDNDNDDRKDREKKKYLRKDKSDRKYSKHNNSSENDDNSSSNYDDDKNSKDNNKDKNDEKSKPSNTVVTTIIIVATETPTTIYSGTVNPAKQKGTGDQSSQVHDPNSSNKGNDGNGPSETELTEQLYHDQSAYRKLVLALSIVGGLAGIALVTGLLIFTRMRIRKRKRKQEELDLELADSSNTSPPPSPPTHHTPPAPPPKARYSTMSDDGDSTVIDFSQNPFMDPSTTLVNNKNHSPYEGRASMLPNTPPALPAHLETSPYSSYRQNRTLSMISQTAGATLPSAPTAKELDAALKYENPFEDEYGSSQRYEYVEESENEIQASPLASPSIIASSPPRLLSQTSQGSYSSSDLPPPPAYTPNVTPSAPPLYALPTNGTLNEPRDDDSIRRHSISNCSIASSTRPLSLRRGSGSLAHISTPFS